MTRVAVYTVATPKGSKSCRTQGDFWSSVCLSVHQLRPERVDLKSGRDDYRLERAYLRPERADLRPKGCEG